jgi:hypothetical protein
MKIGIDEKDNARVIWRALHIGKTLERERLLSANVPFFLEGRG